MWAREWEIRSTHSLLKEFRTSQMHRVNKQRDSTRNIEKTSTLYDMYTLCEQGKTKYFSYLTARWAAAARTSWKIERIHILLCAIRYLDNRVNIHLINKILLRLFLFGFSGMFNNPIEHNKLVIRSAHWSAFSRNNGNIERRKQTSIMDRQIDRFFLPFFLLRLILKYLRTLFVDVQFS